MDDEGRLLLREGDALARAGQPEAALDRYAQVARWYVRMGLALRAVAIYEQIRRLVRASAPSAIVFDEEARRELPSMYRRLGLDAGAVAIERESAALSKRAN